MWNNVDIQGYTLLDAGDGERLERWGKYVLVRPDPVAVWQRGDNPLWHKPDALYRRSDKGGGEWEYRRKVDDVTLTCGGLSFVARPMGFKHMGIFPEQQNNWRYIADYVRRQLQSRESVNMLNLFAYTGCASVYASHAGANVTHVDASKGIIAYAKENAALNGIGNIRYIAEDCGAFLSREIRRGKKYDVILLDPPTYGRGPSGEVWKIAEHLPTLLSQCAQLLNQNALLVLNTYTTALGASVMAVLCHKAFPDANVDADDIGIVMQDNGWTVPAGSTCRVIKS